MRALTVKVKKDIAGLLNAGDILIKQNGHDYWECNDRIIPAVLDISNREYFEEPAMANIPKFKTDDIVLFKNVGCTYQQIGRIFSFNPITAAYAICPLRNGKHELTNIAEERLTLTREYWFINSKGHIHMEYLKWQPEHDAWREAVGLMFDSKEAAETYRNNILERFKKDKESF